MPQMHVTMEKDSVLMSSMGAFAMYFYSFTSSVFNEELYCIAVLWYYAGIPQLRGISCFAYENSRMGEAA